MSEIDWSKAPDGATHYNWNNDMFYKVEDGKVYYGAHGGDWFVSAHNVHDFVEHSATIPRPTKQEWDGGLPPVGCECEYQLKHDEPHEWSRCVIEFVGDECIIAKCWPDETMPEIEQCFKKHEVKFRLLKERQRDELVKLISYHPIYKNAVVSLADDILSHYTLEPKQ